MNDVCPNYHPLGGKIEGKQNYSCLNQTAWMLIRQLKENFNHTHVFDLKITVFFISDEADPNNDWMKGWNFIRIGLDILEMRNSLPVSRIELYEFSLVTLMSYPKSINRIKENHFFASWLYGHLAPLASIITDAQYSLSPAFYRHLLNSISLRLFSTSSSHLNLELPLLLLPFGLL
jgi:hypothetical protein